MTDNSPSLAHEEQTIQDVLNVMSPAKKDLQEVIIGAVLEGDDLSGNPEIVAGWENFTDMEKMILDFFVGNILAEEALKHTDPVDDFLAHYGVKGMKWGVRNSDRPAGAPRLSKTKANSELGRREAREKVRTQTATLSEAHVAGLKSTGHRALNAFTGDKRFWHNMAVTAGVAVAGAAVSTVVPNFMPTSVLRDIGEGALRGLSMGVGLGASVPPGTTTESLVGFGKGMTTLFGLNVVALGVAGSAAANVGTNTVRAVRGNARIDKSYAKLGENMLKRQTDGAKATRKALNKSGSIDKRDIKPRKTVKHDGMEMEWGEYLEHFGVKGMKWGVRKERSTSSSSGGKPQTKAKSPAKAGPDATHNRAAAMVVGKEVAKAAVKYGLPAGAIALGAGIPLAVTLGVSVKVLDDPAVKEALAPVGQAAKSVAKSVGSVKMSDIPNPVSGAKNWIKEQEERAAASRRSIAESEATIKRVNADRAAFDKEIADVLKANGERQAEIAAIESRIADLDREEAALRR
jgi:hypothetical protein